MATNSHIMKCLNLGTQKTTFIKGHKEIILTLDIFENFMISSGKDKIIHLWRKHEDSLNFDIIATFHGHAEAVNYVSFSPKTGN